MYICTQITTSKTIAMKSQSEIIEALEKFNAINALYSSIEMNNSGAINWLRKLNELTTELCETVHWDMLTDKINYVKSLRTA